MSAEEDAVAGLLGLLKPSNEFETKACEPGEERNGVMKQDCHRIHTSSPKYKRLDEYPRRGTGRIHSDKPNSKLKARRGKRKDHLIVEHKYPVPPRIIQKCYVPKTYVDHSYKDMSCVPQENDYQPPTEIASMAFSEKLHHILSSEVYHDCIAWVEHGRAFRILIPKFLEERQILYTYFGHNRYSYFLSQLQHYGFKKISHGRDANAFYHESMLRGMPHLCKYMPEYQEGRKLIADPSNEIDLYAVSKVWPIPFETSYRPTSWTTSVVPSNNYRVAARESAIGEASRIGMVCVPLAMACTERKMHTADAIEQNFVSTQVLDSMISAIHQRHSNAFETLPSSQIDGVLCQNTIGDIQDSTVLDLIMKILKATQAVPQATLNFKTLLSLLLQVNQLQANQTESPAQHFHMTQSRQLEHIDIASLLQTLSQPQQQDQDILKFLMTVVNQLNRQE